MSVLAATASPVEIAMVPGADVVMVDADELAAFIVIP